jgi:DNA repair exonuclease SbcCD ATPase subunit
MVKNNIKKTNRKHKKAKIVKAHLVDEQNDDAIANNQKVIKNTKKKGNSAKKTIQPKVITLSDEKNEIKNVIHMADIHIPAKRGFDIYIKLFDTLFEELGKKKNSAQAVFISGDVLDEGCFEGDPRVRNTLEYLINGLLNFFPVFIILGNHEVRHSSKYDCDNPFEYMIGKEFSKGKKNTCYVLNEDANYVYNNLVICPTQFATKHATECVVKDKYPIGMYHGQLYRSQSDGGFMFEDESLFRVTDFTSRYNITLLGDIHKRSFLDAKKTVAYCGSFRQLNDGEDFEKGVLRWNLKTKKSRFIPIKDETKKTYNVSNKKSLSDFVSNYDKYKNIGQLKIRVGTRSEVNEARELLQEANIYDADKIQIVPIKKNRNIEKDIDLSMKIGKGDFMLDMKDKKGVIDVAMEYAKENIKDNGKALTPNVLNKIRHAIETHTKDVRYNVSNKMKEVTIKELKFDNIMIYGEGNVVNFNNLKGLVGIIADNGSGKSALLDALLISIFSKSNRCDYKDAAKNGSLKSNTRNGRFKTFVRFQVNEKVYAIERVYTDKNKGKHNSAGTKLEFYEEKDGKNSHIFSGSSNAAWGKKFEPVIEKHLCSFEDFRDNFCMLQNDEHSSFVNMKSEDRKNMLLKVFKVDIFSEIGTKINEWRKNLGTRKGDNTSKFSTVDLSFKNQPSFEVKSLKIDHTLHLLNETTKNNNARMKEITKKVKDMNASIAEKEKNSVRYADYIKDYKKIDNIKTLTKQLDKLKNQQKKENDHISEYDKDIKKTEKDIKNNNKKIKKDKSHYTKAQKTLKTHEKSIEKNEKKKSSLEDTLEEEEYVKKNVEYYEKIIENSESNDFKKKIKDLILKYDKKKIKVDKLVNNIMDVSLEVSDDRKVVDDAESCIEKINNNEKIRTNNAKIQQNIDKLTQNIEKLEKENEKLEETIEEYEELSENREKMEKKLEYLNKDKKTSTSELGRIDECIEKLSKQIRRLKSIEGYDSDNIDTKSDVKQVKVLENEFRGLDNENINNNTTVENIKEYYKELKALNEEDHIYKLVGKIFSNEGGINGYLLSRKIIPFIQTTVNKVLEDAGFVYSINLICTEKSIEFRVNKTQDSKYEVNAEHNSGFEKDMLNVIIMFVLTQVNTRLKSNFMIIDEPFARADSDNIDNMKSMLEYWKKLFKYIIIISHNDEIKDQYDMKKEIQKTDKYTSLVNF